MTSNPDQQRLVRSSLLLPHLTNIITRLITEVKGWCSKLGEMVNDSGKKLMEEIKSSGNPAGLKFLQNEDLGSLLIKAQVGILTPVAVLPDDAHTTPQFKKHELTTIKEVEVRSCLLFELYNVMITILFSGVSRIFQLDSRVCCDRQVERG